MRNEFTLQGFIVYDSLSDRRGSIMIKPGGYQDTVEAPMLILIRDMLHKYQEKGFHTGQFVKVTAKIQSYVHNVKNRDGSYSNEKRYHQEAYVQDIVALDPVPGDFDEPSRFPEPMNRGILEGELLNIYRLSPTIIRMTVLTITDDRRSYVTCYRNQPNAQRVMDKLRVGDQLHLKCYLTNQQKEHNGVMEHYQDVMIDRISIVNN